MLENLLVVTILAKILQVAQKQNFSKEGMFMRMMVWKNMFFPQKTRSRC